jgi:hypothetical protein
MGNWLPENSISLFPVEYSGKKCQAAGGIATKEDMNRRRGKK